MEPLFTQRLHSQHPEEDETWPLVQELAHKTPSLNVSTFHGLVLRASRVVGNTMSILQKGKLRFKEVLLLVRGYTSSWSVAMPEFEGSSSNRTLPSPPPRPVIAIS